MRKRARVWGAMGALALHSMFLGAASAEGPSVDDPRSAADFHDGSPADEPPRAGALREGPPADAVPTDAALPYGLPPEGGLPDGPPAEGPPRDEQDPEEGAPGEESSRSSARHPQGALLFQGAAGVASGDGGTRVVVGLGVGFAVSTGVAPGIRGLLIAGDRIGGELATTLTLTPPFGWSVTPFVSGELGRRWDLGLQGWLYGAGGGVFLGDLKSSFGVQVGWGFRWFRVDRGRTYGAGGPVLGFVLRF